MTESHCQCAALEDVKIPLEHCALAPQQTPLQLGRSLSIEQPAAHTFNILKYEDYFKNENKFRCSNI
jgi:hypothetical protein